jgi:hypothetical protein
MAKYAGFRYEASLEDGAKLYGGGSIPSLSVGDFTSNVVDYNDVRLSWLNPAGDIRRFRILRNQEGIPDTEEDGIIIYDSSSIPNFNTLVDNGTTVFGETIPLIKGRHVYYSIWLWLGEDQDNRWYLAGTAYTTVPSEHAVLLSTGARSTTHTRLMESLPKALTSPDMNALGTIDYDGDLSKFLSGFSFTADQWMTLADLLLPNESLINLTPELLNSYSLNFGISPDNRSTDKPTKFQRKLLSNALTLYSTKGTAQALANFLEAITGYSIAISESANLMLTSQDATFFEGVGNWAATTGATLTAVSNVAVPSTGVVTADELAYRVDSTYCGKVVIAVADSGIDNGFSNPKLQGIPVQEGVLYNLSFYQKSAVTADITVTVNWHDYLGNVIPDSAVTDDLATTTAWSKVSLFLEVVPADAKFMSIKLRYSEVGDFYIDMVQVSDYTVTNFQEARGVGILLSPSKINYIYNPSFEVDTAGWSATNATISDEDLESDIPGLFSGLKHLLVAPSDTSEVSVSVTAPSAVTSDGEFTFSSYVFSELIPEDGIEIKLEAYAVEPYVNYVTTPTPTSAPTTGWSFSSGGTFTQSFPEDGGHSDGAYTAWTYSSSPTTGDITLSIDSDGIDATLVAGAEYTFSLWIKADVDVSLYPTVVWTTASGAGEDIINDAGSLLDLTANTWTQVSFTTICPSDVDSFEAAIVLPVSSIDTEIELFAVSDAEFFPVTYTSSLVIPHLSSEEPSGLADNVWSRIESSINIPSDAVIPDDIAGLSVDVTLSFIPSGENLLLDAAQFERGFRATDYFDGSFYSANWDGGDTNAHEAESHLYANKDGKLTRIQQNIRDYLPLGTPFYISSTTGVEFNGFFKDYA